MPQRKCLTKVNSEQRGTLQQGIGPLCSHTFHGSPIPPGKNPTTQFGIQGLYGVWPHLLASEINPSPNSAFQQNKPHDSYVGTSIHHLSTRPEYPHRKRAVFSEGETQENEANSISHLLLLNLRSHTVSLYSPIMVTGQARFKKIECRHIPQREENQHEFLRKACEMGYILWWPFLKDAIFHTNHTGLGKNLNLGEIG